MNDFTLERWLCGDWHGLLPMPWAAVALSLVAVVCGSAIGVERERKGKAVGFRTLTLVSLGAATFTQLSTTLGGADGQGGRAIASQVVTGVGFLGAGAILRSNVGVTGITSAAALWAMSAVGMTAGAGYGGAALGLSGLIVAVLTVISALEHRYLGPCRWTSARVSFRAERGKGRVRIEELLDESRVLPSHRQWETPGGEHDPAVTVCYCHVHLQHKEFLSRLAGMAEVLEIIPADPARLSANAESVTTGPH